jgi:hypothetical protein
MLIESCLKPSQAHLSALTPKNNRILTYLDHPQITKKITEFWKGNYNPSNPASGKVPGYLYLGSVTPLSHLIQ